MDEQPNRRASDLPPDAPWWARKLVDGWTECWKWLSTWMIAIAASAPLLYENLSAVQDVLSVRAFHYLQAALVVLIFLGRIKRQ